LKVGVHIDKLSFYNYKVEGLYIKLDKKFILKAKKVNIPRTKAKPSFGSVEKTFRNIKNVLSYFEYIELKNIHFENNNLKILYSDDVFFLSTKDYEISTIVHKNRDQISAEITNLHINKGTIDINGTLIFDAKTDLLQSHGHFYFSDSNGTFTLIKDHKDIIFSMGSGNFNDIKHILKDWQIPEEILIWLVDKVKAKEYKLDSFSIQASLDTYANVIPDFNTIKAQATLKNVDIFFENGLEPVNADKLNIIYEHNTLYFLLKKPIYKNKDLNGSCVTIKNVISDLNSLLEIKLDIYSKLDNDIKEILQKYNINIPIISNNMQKINILLNIPLIKKKDKNIKVIVDSNITKDHISIANVPIDIEHANVYYENNIVYLKNVFLKNKNYHTTLQGKVDIQSKKVLLQSYVKYLYLKNKQKKDIFILKDKKLPIYIDYKNIPIIDLPVLSTSIKIYKNKTIIKISKLSKVISYIKNLPIKIYDGMLEVVTKDFINYKFYGTLKWNQCFFYKNDNICLSRIKYSGRTIVDGIKLYAFDKSLYINSAKSVLKLNKLNIDIDKFLKFTVYSNNKNKNKFYIYGNQSTMRYKGYHLVTDSYDIIIYPNGNIKAMGSLDNDIVKFEKKSNHLTIKAYRIKDTMLHPLINFNGLKYGRYTFKSSGNPDKEMQGEILIEGGILSDFKAYNNTLAFINTIPAFATLSKPGFSNKGFEIKEGMIVYKKSNDIIYLTSVYIKGSSTNIAGEGTIDLKNKTLNISLAIQVAKDFAKIVSKIPLVGYILMGKDESITLGLTIKGTFANPKVQTSVAKDVLSLPFMMLQRTFGK